MKVWIVTHTLAADFPRPEREALPEVYDSQEKALARHDALLDQPDVLEVSTLEREVL